MNNIIHTDICIIGAGMVGLSLANQISERYPNLSITIIEKKKLENIPQEEIVEFFMRVFITNQEV